MSADHQRKLAEGRRLSADVKAYLEALEEHKPKRGRRRTRQGIEKRLAVIGSEIRDASALQRVQLAQERIDLERELDGMTAPSDIEDARQPFVRSAKKYSERKGISYAAWREAGVPADVLREAGITRASS